jgi:outer membrane protein assembly factor BamB
MRTWLTVIAAPFLLILLTGCSWIRGGESNLEPPEELAEFTASAKVTKLWSVNAGKGPGKQYLILSPALDNKVIYVSDKNGRVSAFNAQNGKRIWRVDLAQPITAATGYGNDLLLLGTRKGQVIALQKQDGKQRWTAAVSSEILAPPVAQAGIVVVHTVDEKIFGLSAKDGKLLWMEERAVPPLTLRGTGAPLIVNNAVLAGFANGKLVALNLNDGRLRWETTVAEPRGRNEIERLVDVDAPPLVYGNVVYAAAYQGKIVAVNLDSGRIVWARDTSTYNAMDRDGENLYVTDEQGNIFALNLRTGASEWEQKKLFGRTPSPPAALGNYIAVGDFAGYVHLLSKQGGAFAARYKIGGDPIKTKPLADIQSRENIFYVLDQDGDLVALRIQ